MPSTALYRVTRAGHGPWRFSGDLRGRFDLPSQNGSCYLARDAIAALLEVLGPTLELGAVSSTFMDARRIHRVHVPSQPRLADLTSRRAARFGITAEVGTITPYDKPQAWARALYGAGYDGVAFSLRHDPSPRRDGVALFGPEGERRWRRGRAEPIDQALRAKLQKSCGIRVLDVPRSDQLAYEDE